MADAKRPYRQRVNAPSNSALFEKRGDPWVSQRQGLEDFGRILETENPDMDSFTRAHKAKEHRERGPDKPIKPKAEAPDDQRRAANANLKHHNRVKAAREGVVDARLAAIRAAMKGEN